jgi:methyl-accepting chemotaxis protein
MSAGNESMLRELNQLQTSAQEISSRMDAISAEIGNVSKGAQDVSTLARTNRSAIEKIALVTDGFKV